MDIAPPEELICKAPVASISKVVAEIVPASPPSPKSNWPLASKVPATVRVPDPVVEIFPEVVMLSPEVEGDNVVPVLDQYPSVPDEAQVDPETQMVPEASGRVQVLVPDKVVAVNSPTLELLLKNSEFPEPPLVKAAPEVTSPTAVISPPVPVAEMVKVLVVLSVANVTPEPASTLRAVVVELAVIVVWVGTTIDENRF